MILVIKVLLTLFTVPQVLWVWIMAWYCQEGENMFTKDSAMTLTSNQETFASLKHNTCITISTLSIFVSEVWPDEAKQRGKCSSWTMIYFYLQAFYRRFACVSQVGTGRGWKIAKDFKLRSAVTWSSDLNTWFKVTACPLPQV